VGAFVLTAGDMRGEEMAAVFVATMPSILRHAAKVQRPFVFTLTRSGTLKRII
jgi:hypothetical protein